MLTVYSFHGSIDELVIVVVITIFVENLEIIHHWRMSWTYLYVMVLSRVSLF